MKVIYREALEQDVPFVLSSWLKSYARFREPDVSADDYYSGHHDVLVRLLSTADVVVACPDNSRDLIVGYCAFRMQTIHYLYVKHIYRVKYLRDERVALSLLAACVDVTKPIVVSHKTKAGMKFLANNNQSATYNPYEAYLAGFVDHGKEK